MEKDYLTIAKIVKPQGIRGEMKVLAMTDSAEDLCAFNRVYVGGNAYKVLKVRPQNTECAFITLAGIADRNAAELLRGQEVLADRADAPELPEGRFYIVDVIGCRVEDGEGNFIGTVTGVTPARTDVYEVEEESGAKLIFPAATGVIENIDASSKLVRVDGKRLKEVALEEK